MINEERMKKVMALARAMCVADGFDPDKWYIGYVSDFCLQEPLMSDAGVQARGMMWEKYKRRAHLFLAAQEAFVNL